MSDKTIGKKNLFSFATKELSQDAFLRWLIESVNDHAVKKVSRAFIKEMLKDKNGKLPVDYDFNAVKVLKTKAQWEKVDVVAELELSDKKSTRKKVLLAIEDKVDSTEHDGQVNRYAKALDRWPGSEQCDKVKVYYKTWILEEEEKNRVKEAGCKVFGLENIARFFQGHKSDYKKSEIVKHYAEYVIRRDKDSKEIPSKPFAEWSVLNYDTWFRKVLKEKVHEELRSRGLYLKGLNYRGKYYSVFVSKGFNGCGVSLELRFCQKEEKRIRGFIYPRKDNGASGQVERTEAWKTGPVIKNKLKSIIESARTCFNAATGKSVKNFVGKCILDVFDRETQKFISHEEVCEKLIDVIKDFDDLFSEQRVVSESGKGRALP